MRVAEVRSCSFHLRFVIRDADTVYADAHAVYVAVDPATATSRTLTDAPV